MKLLVSIIIGCLTLLITTYSFAWCSSCKTFESSNVEGTCGYISCRPGARCPTAYDCDCADPYCTSGDNSCMNCSSCCDAFGNVGAR